MGWFQENKKLVGALGAGIGGILGLKAGKGDTQGSAGYQGGIPEYQYGRTLKDDAFANTYQQEVPATEWYTTPEGMLGQRNIPGETTSVTTPRRAGGKGRSYFNYPEAGSYSPVTTTDPDTGVVTENLLGGDYLDTLTAAADKARTDEEAFYQDLGQSYLDAYDANAALAGVTEGSDVITAGVVPVEESIDLSGTVIDTSDIPTATGGLPSLSTDPATTAYVTSSSLPATSVFLTPGSTTTTTTGSASDLYNYLTGLGFGENAKSITVEDVENFTNQGVFALDDIATALGTDASTLLSIANYTPPTALETSLSDMGFAVEGGRTITADDITNLTDAGYAAADIATALGTDVSTLLDIVNYIPPTALETSLSDMGFAAEGGRTITAGDITSLTDDGYALADIATALGVTEAQLNSISSYVAPTNLQTTLSDMGFAAEGGRTITVEDITALTDDGYALADIATALGVTEAQLNSISNYTAPPAAATAVNELLIAAGFGGDGRAITSDDVAGWKAAVANQSVYTLSDIAAAFGMSETELLAIDTSGAATGGLLENNGYYLGGSTDGMADEVPATISGDEPARLSDGEFVVPADVVSHLGNGNSDAGATQLYSMMDRVRQERTGTTMQGAQINPMQQLPA
jgi:AraC-like DNA-binding protein